MPQTLKKIDGVYHAPVFAGGRTKWISTGADTKAEAQKVLAESGVERLNVAAKAGRLTRKAISQVLTGRNLTCLKALEKYREMKTNSIAPKTLTNHSLTVSNWMEDTHVENQPPSAITPQQLGRWLNNPKSTWKRSTREVMLSGLRSFFGFCADQGWIVSNPSQLVEVDYKVLSHEQKETISKEPFTDEEIKLLLSALRKDWKRAENQQTELFRDGKEVIFWLVAVTTGRDTGLRLSDIAQLGWRSFEKQGRMVIWTGKTNQRLELSISQELQDLVSEIPVNDPDYLFPEQRAIASGTKRYRLSVYFGRLCERLGIEGKSFHSLRHYKATHEFAKMDKKTLAAKLAETLTMEQIAALLGHANSKTTKGYVH